MNVVFSFQEIPGGLPSKYEQALQQREKEVESWQQAIKDAGLTRAQKKQFQALVENKFQVGNDKISIAIKCKTSQEYGQNIRQKCDIFTNF